MKSYDFFEDELNTLVATELETVWDDIPERDPARVQANREAFLREGRQMAWRATPQIALRYAAILVLLLLGSYGTAQVMSASSLPGDTLYPIKLSMESVTGLFYDGSWQNDREALRLAEVMEVAERGHIAMVNFMATPTVDANGQWSIENIPLIVDDEQSWLLAHQCPDRTTQIRIFGRVENGVIYPTAITPDCLFVVSNN